MVCWAYEEAKNKFSHLLELRKEAVGCFDMYVTITAAQDILKTNKIWYKNIQRQWPHHRHHQSFLKVGQLMQLSSFTVKLFVELRCAC